MEKRRVIVIREDILSDEHLTPADKLIYARISAFENYFESAEACAELLRVSVSAVQKAKAKLENLGYITCVKNTGRGKVYRTNLDYLSDLQNLPVRLAKSASQSSKICQHSKDREEIEVLDTNVSKAKSHDDEQKEYGNSEINAIFQAWDDAGLPAITSRVQANRRAVWNMLRNKAIGKGKILELIRLTVQSQSDPYAPGVPDLETLSRRVAALEQWKIRQQAKANELTKPVEPVYQRRPYDDRPEILDREPVREEISDEFFEQCRQKFIRKGE